VRVGSFPNENRCPRCSGTINYEFKSGIMFYWYIIAGCRKGEEKMKNISDRVFDSIHGGAGGVCDGG